MSQLTDLNPRPADYKSATIPFAFTLLFFPYLCVINNLQSILK